jgi:hypothetical protein
MLRGRIIEVISSTEVDPMISTIAVVGQIHTIEEEETHGTIPGGMMIVPDNVIMATVAVGVVEVGAVDMDKAITTDPGGIPIREEVEAITGEVGAATITTRINPTDIQREPVTRPLRIMGTRVTAANKAAMVVAVVEVLVVGLIVTDIALAQPVTVEEGTVITKTHVMNGMGVGVKSRVIIQLDISLAVVTLTTLADTVAREGINEGKCNVMSAGNKSLQKQHILFLENEPQKYTF